MASWGALPFEILYCILNHVNQPDLPSCLFTCKNWHMATQGLMYNSVKLFSQKQLTSFANAMTKDNGPSQMVKKISILFPFSSDLSLADVLSRCRFIKTIDPVHFDSPEAATAFYTTIIMHHHCPLLESIPFPKDGDPSIYAQAAWHLRDRLLRLMISDHLYSFDNSLVAFPRLNYLLCHVSDDIYAIDKLIHTSKSLRSVEINQRTRISETLTDYDHLKIPCHHIKEWIGSGIILPSRRLLRWLMHVFPNLIYLNIFFALNTLKSQLSVDNVLHTDIAVQFLLHTYRNIPTLNLEQMYVLHSIEVAIGFLEGCLTHPFQGTLEIRYENDYHHPEHVSLTHTKLLVKCVQPLHTPYTILPHRDLIRRFGHHLTGVVLDFGDAYALYLGDQEVNRNDVHGYCLDYLFKYCPHIQILELGNFLFTHCDPTKTPHVLCHTLKALVFDCCEFSNTALQEISQRLPQLSCLSILDSDFEFDSIWEMLLYDTHLDTLYLKDTGHEDSEDDYHEFYLCLEMEQQTLFYSGTSRDQRVQINLEEEGTMYRHTFDMDDKLTIRIACKSITVFHLDIPNIKTLIKYPGQPNQQILVHPSEAYLVESARFSSQINS